MTKAERIADQRFNIRPGGLTYDEAAAKAAWLLRAAQALGATGVTLKDDMPATALPTL